MAHLGNLRNDYQNAIEHELFDEIPKSVWAAIAISALTCGGDKLAEAPQLVAKEWEVLHLNGIVPQKPGKHARAALSATKD